MLEYFSSTHGARKGLADTALKTADSGYLTRKLADVAQNVVITLDDCGTLEGVAKSVVYKGEEIERSLAESIRGRVARKNVTNVVTGEVIIRENEMITWEQARQIEALGVDKIVVRSPMTCEASLGVCRLCYGMDLATGNLVEEGMAVGIIAAQSIGEPGTQLTMRTFHIGGVATSRVEESEAKAKRAGVVKFERINAVINDKSERVALTRNGLISIVGPKDRKLEDFAVPNGSILFVEEGQTVNPGQLLCKWDPHMTPILAEVGDDRGAAPLQGQRQIPVWDPAADEERPRDRDRFPVDLDLAEIDALDDRAVEATSGLDPQAQLRRRLDRVESQPGSGGVGLVADRRPGLL